MRMIFLFYQMNPRKVAYSSIFLALGVALGYALSWLPNIELVSFVCALSGYWLGAGLGMLTGAGIYMLYSFLSPYGMAPMPLWIAQGIGGAVFAFLGVLFVRCKSRLAFYGAVAGALGTLFYDAITSVAGFIFFPSGNTLVAYIVAGAPFYAAHILSNTIIFAVLFPAIAKFRGKRQL